jgi:hypothetical protein
MKIPLLPTSSHQGRRRYRLSSFFLHLRWFVRLPPPPRWGRIEERGIF